MQKRKKDKVTLAQLVTTFVGGIGATAALYADVLQLAHPFSISLTLHEFGLPPILTMITVALIYLFFTLAILNFFARFLRWLQKAIFRSD